MRVPRGIAWSATALMAISGYAIIAADPDEHRSDSFAAAGPARSNQVTSSFSGTPLRINTATSSASQAQQPGPTVARTFSAAYPLFAAAGVSEPKLVRVAEAASRPRSTASQAAPEIGTTADKPAPRPVGGGADHALRSSGGRVQDLGQRRDLARSIQEELRRVGCYSGDIDGSWGTSTQRAMRTFTERVNATLPTDQPDYILLTLLQGQTETTCGPTCRSGETMSSNGTCLPRAIVAQQQRTPAQSAAARQQAVPSNTASPATSSDQRVAAASSWATRVERVPSETPAPLPGRMAIGAPASRMLITPESLPPEAAPSEPQIAAAIAEARRVQAEMKRRERLAKAEDARQRLEEIKSQQQQEQIERQARLAQERRERLAATESARAAVAESARPVSSAPAKADARGAPATPDASGASRTTSRMADAASTKTASQPLADAVASWGPPSSLGAGSRAGLQTTAPQITALAPMPEPTAANADTSDEPRFVQKFTPPHEQPAASRSRPSASRPVVHRPASAPRNNDGGSFKATIFARLSRSAP